MKSSTLFPLLLVCSFYLPAQSSQLLLHKDTVVERKIQSGEYHEYDVATNENQFLMIVVEQKGIDLEIELQSPDAEKPEKFDRPNGRFGPEYVTIHNSTAGTYSLKVTPLSSEETIDPGKYTIALKRQEPVASTHEGRIDQLMAPWNNSNTPGATIAVIQNGQVIFKKGYGAANLEHGQLLSPSSVFQVASVSKQFTAFAIATLIDEGLIHPKDDVRKYIPEVPDFGKTITIEHLVHHTSGLRDLFSFLSLAGWNADDFISKDHILKMVVRQRELNFPPGSEYSYSNTGYVLMGEIVERVTGKTLPEWMQENVFAPLNMNHTFINDRYTRLVPNRANAYFAHQGSYDNDLLVYSSTGETGLYTNTEDLSKWVLNFETKAVGSPEVHRLMRSKGILNNGDTISYAYGLRISTYRGLKRIAHSGSHSGYRTFMGYFPEQRFGVIVFGNAGSSFSASGTGYDVAELYLESQMNPPEKEEISDDSEEDIPYEAQNLSKYAGVYYSREAETAYTLVTKENQIRATHFRLEDIILRPIQENHFKGNRGFFGDVVFELNEQGEVSGFRVSSGRTKNVLFEKRE